MRGSTVDKLKPRKGKSTIKQRMDALICFAPVCSLCQVFHSSMDGFII